VGERRLIVGVLRRTAPLNEIMDLMNATRHRKRNVEYGKQCMVGAKMCATRYFKLYVTTYATRYDDVCNEMY
jgi:hypothetical protein